MLGCVAAHGKLGITAVGNSPERSAQLYAEVVATLDHAAG
jgi:hypothetical protein